ncbi:MAG TPA: DUF4397 domain-containing protein [Niastella sp.]
MKRKMLISIHLLKGLVLSLVTTLFFSCEKNDIDESGSFNIKVVNASPGTLAQGFTLANQVLVNGGLNFTDASNYINTSSGKRLVAEFKNEGTNSVTATGELYTINGVSFTVYLAGQGSSSRVKAYEDDLAVPNNGKVKIKFIHLSDAAPSDIYIKNGAGDDLVTNISRNIQSGYKYVDPGTLSFKLYGTASRNNIGNFDIPDLQSGKIYTLYLTGSTDATLAINKVLHN